jgi:hypothetical protein
MITKLRISDYQGFICCKSAVAKINVGLFSRKVVELVKATDTAVSLDETQYQLCMALHRTRDEALKSICERIHLQLI